MWTGHEKYILGQDVLEGKTLDHRAIGHLIRCES